MAETVQLKRFAGAEIFSPSPPHRASVRIDPGFVPLDRSVIWQCNAAFWKHLDLWEKAHGGSYEVSLPAGISESHRPEFVAGSVDRFVRFLQHLADSGTLPQDIVVIEQGPGSGHYARQFLERMKLLSTPEFPFYDRLRFVLSDMSPVILEQVGRMLTEHKDHIELYHQRTGQGFPRKYEHQALLVRHGNMWDQLPCRLISARKGSASEIHVRAFIEPSFAETLKGISGGPSMLELARMLRDGNIDDVVTRWPAVWEPLVRSIKLETTNVPLDPHSFPQQKALHALLEQEQSEQELLVNTGALDNLAHLVTLVDFARGGYIEIVDLIVPTLEGFDVVRRPSRFDGCIAAPVNGPLLRAFLAARGKHVSLQKIRGINMKLTIRDHTLSSLLRSGTFVTMGEVAARNEQTPSELQEEARRLFASGVDIVAFSDQAHGWDDFQPIEQLLGAHIFPPLHARSIVPVFASRRKRSREHVAELTKTLLEQGIESLFVVTGDPPPDKSAPVFTSLDLLPVLSKDFFTGSVALPEVRDIPRTIEKVNAGAKFLIVQSTYDLAAFDDWVAKIQAQKLHERVFFIPSLIPIVSKRSLEMISSLPDVPVSADIRRLFDGLDDGAIRAKGIELARSMVQGYRDAGIFSGVYVFAKSAAVVRETLTDPKP